MNRDYWLGVVTPIVLLVLAMMVDAVVAAIRQSRRGLGRYALWKCPVCKAQRGGTAFPRWLPKRSWYWLSVRGARRGHWRDMLADDMADTDLGREHEFASPLQSPGRLYRAARKSRRKARQ